MNHEHNTSSQASSAPRDTPPTYDDLLRPSRRHFLGASALGLGAAALSEIIGGTLGAKLGGRAAHAARGEVAGAGVSQNPQVAAPSLVAPHALKINDRLVRHLL
jgi:hypothetical protein